MTNVNEWRENLIGINRHIWASVLESLDLPAEYYLHVVRSEVRNFLTETDFGKRRELALSIINKSLQRHGKSGTLEPFLSALANIEAGVQRYNRNLRDHVNHSVYVYLLGLLLMKETNEIGLVDPLGWKIAALLHDIGYPLQLFASSFREYLVLFQNHKLKMSGFETPIKYSASLEGLEVLKFSDSDAFTIIENRLRTWKIRLNLRSVWDEQQEQGKLSHGILSALITINLIDSLYEKNNEQHEKHKLKDEVDWGKDCFDEQILPAVAAISLHDILDDVGSISLDDSPIAYFLVLSDALQQWNRYQPRKRVYKPSSVCIEFGDFQIACNLNLPKNRMQEIEEAVGKLHSQMWKVHIERVT